MAPPEMSSRPPLAILFDCDGVLADTERDGHRVSFNKVFAEKGLGFEWGVEEYGRLCEVSFDNKVNEFHNMNCNCTNLRICRRVVNVSLCYWLA